MILSPWVVHDTMLITLIKGQRQQRTSTWPQSLSPSFFPAEHQSLKHLCQCNCSVVSSLILQRSVDFWSYRDVMSSPYIWLIKNKQPVGELLQQIVSWSFSVTLAVTAALSLGSSGEADKLVGGALQQLVMLTTSLLWHHKRSLETLLQQKDYSPPFIVESAIFFALSYITE